MTRRQLTTNLARISVGATGQAFSGLSNFLAAAFVIRHSTPGGIAAFGIVSACYFLLVGVVRSCGAEAVLFEPNHDRRNGTTFTIALRGAWVTSAAGTGVVFAAAALSESPLRGFLLTLGVSLVPLAMHETLRVSLLAQGRGMIALVGDVAWVAIFLALILGRVPDIIWRDDPARHFSTWALSGALSLLILWFSAHPVWRTRDGGRWLHERSTLFSADFLLTAGTVHAGVLLLQVVGPTVVAEWRVAQTIASPAIAPLAALSVGMIAWLSQSSPTALSLHYRWGVMSIGAATAAMSLLCLFIPNSVIQSVFSRSFDLRLLSALIVLAAGLMLLGSQPAAALKLSGLDRQATLHKAITGPMGLITGFFASQSFGAVGMALGLSAAYLARMALGLHALNRRSAKPLRQGYVQ